MEELSTTTRGPFRVVSAGKDIGPMYSLCKMAGWNQTIEDLKLLTELYTPANLLAVADENDISNPLGSGLVLNVGASMAWIGMILVHPEHRRKGVASAIMEQCMDVARMEMGHSIVGLDATPDGLQVYEKLGFQQSFKLWRCQLKTSTSIKLDTSVKLMRGLSMYKYIEMLQDMNLHTKLAGLSVIQKMHPEGVWVAQAEGQPIGMVMTRPGRLKPFIGPLMASSPGVARTLLNHVLKYWKEKGHEEVFIDVPEKHFNSASRCVLSSGIKPARSFIRMYEVISDDNFARLTTRKSDDTRRVRSIETLQHGLAAFEATVTYMKQEKETLQYIYAAGGPELS